MKTKIMLVFGTRPEAIKMAPLVKEFQCYPDQFETVVVSTGQHREMLKPVLDFFELTSDYDLAVMKQGQSLNEVTSKILMGMQNVLEKEQPDYVLVHGDTTTSMAAALAAFYARIKVGHVEAGLRTHNLMNPWPEEMNRQLTARMASFHFAPTETNRSNLLKEGIEGASIFVTGNTVIDALKMADQKIGDHPELLESLTNELTVAGYDVERLGQGRRMVLVTGHRRENFGDGFLSINNALKDLAAGYPEVDFIYPVHMNPNVREPIDRVFGDSVPENIFFIHPLGYLPFIYLLRHCHVVLTDSGGIQEEASALGKPVLLMRETTERPEAILAGNVRLVGNSSVNIVDSVSRLLSNVEEYSAMCATQNPYGDGQASAEIVSSFIEMNNSKPACISYDK